MLIWLKDNGCPFSESLCISNGLGGGHVALVEWLMKQPRVTITSDDICMAAVNGRFEAIKWLKENGHLDPTDTEVFKNAVESGDLPMLTWMKEIGFSLTEEIFAHAAAECTSFNLSTLEWLHSNGCPWTADTFTKAAQQGDLEVLKWLLKKGCPWNSDTRLAAEKTAQEKGNREVIDWLDEMGCP